MPSKSKAQRNLMAAAAHNPAFAKKVGVPVSVAKEFNQADKGKKFKGGGMATKCATKSDAKMIAKKEVKGHESSMHGMKKGGACKGYAKGGIIEKGTGEKYSSKAAMMKHEKKESKAEEMKEHGMKKGGMCGGKYARGGGIEVRGKTKGRII
jgi:hypothetical protein